MKDPFKGLGMSIHEHATEFAGKRVAGFRPRAGIEDPAGVAYRIEPCGRLFRPTPTRECLNRFLADPRAGEVSALIVGNWFQETEDNSAIVEALVSARETLTALRALFLGDITSDECELSWIRQTDLSPLFPAFPLLEELRIRGGEGLRLGAVSHDHLKSLTIETGGLSREVVQDLGRSRLPALEKLVLWLGEEEFGGDVTLEDLGPILSGTLFPKLSYLGLCDSLLADELAEAAVNAPVVRQLEVLDLSLGNLGDEGARALLALPTDAKLRRLDIHHHYVSDDLIAQLRQLPFEVEAGDPQVPDGPSRWERYIAHSE